MGTRVSTTEAVDNDTLTTGPIQGSTKHYLEVDELRIPQRRIHLTNGEYLDVYDTSGPYTDPRESIDVANGLAPTRDQWQRPPPSTALPPNWPGPERVWRHRRCGSSLRARTWRSRWCAARSPPDGR
ncbi:phosphomethylpyrimidine synthase [Gordonia polyisoprenivorans NBRC 16320 = JCM 10675]|nr:phosphomethylpyrimidine synthase [Gordonia polyisoprenivorans NBRC 16320 = JCM 10675]